MARSPQAVLEFQAGSLSAEDLAVSRFAGREQVSAPYAFEVDFHQRNGATLELADLVGAEAVLTLRTGSGSERLVHGILWAVELAAVAAGKPSYRAQLVPALRRLEHVRRSRIFQAMSLPDIVEKVLKDGKVKVRRSLSGSYGPSEFCLQYRESDLAFVSRLLEREGIFYFFEHDRDEHVMVLADARDRCPAIAGEPSVPFRVLEPGGAQEEAEYLLALEQVRRIRPGKVLLRDFDFQRPELHLEVTAQSAEDGNRLDHFEYPGGFQDPGAGGRRAKVRLEELGRDRASFHGKGTCVRLMPGATFEVVEHAVEAFNQELTLLAVTHRAEQTRVGAGGVGLDYGNEFEAQDANLPVRPALRTPIPTARLETATVVGPAGEEIHVDKYGRVKVHFHWDREGSRDDKASCWIRCAQAWAGAAWGASLVPRVGQEVLVRFLGGDPDRPLVVGTVYNGMNPPPLSMPGEKTRSTLRSDSSPGGQGGNELRLEDQAGSEQVYLHAQHDQRIRVENDETALVRGAQTLEVSKDRTIQVHGNQQLEVAGSEVLAVDASQTLTVAGGRSTVVLGMQRETMAGQQVSAVGGERSLTVALAGSETVVGVGALTVGAAYSVAVGGLVNLAVGGLYSVAVARDRVEVVGAARQEMVASDSTATLQDEWVLDVDGQVGQQTSGDHDEIVDGKLLLEVKEKVIWTAKEISLEADQLSFVVGGNVALAIDRGGNVTFGAKGFAVDGSDLKLKGSKLQLADAGSAASATSSVPTLDPLDDPRAAVELTLNDQNGDPIRNEPYRVELPDGIVKKGFTDAKGHARVSGKERGSAKVTFPQRDKSAVRKG